MKNIFLVEDNAMYAEEVKVKLSESGIFNISIFSTGEELFKFLEIDKTVPDIIVLDYLLNSIEPDAVNGAQILQVLRSKYKERISMAPIIMLSGLTDVNEVVSLLKKGAKDYILKDSSVHENLKKSINNILEYKQLQTEMNDYKNQVSSLKKRLMLTLGVIVIFVVSVAGYFIFFK